MSARSFLLAAFLAILAIPLGLSTVLAEPPDSGPTSEITCPYLRQKKAKANGSSASNPLPMCDFEANLERLTVASKLYALGEERLLSCDKDAAILIFAQIHTLCPGSRYDLQAAKQLKRMASLDGETGEATGAYEQEMQQEPATVPAVDPIELSLHPHLPPIDPSLIDALQKALKEAGDLGVARLILHVEQQPGNDDQENAVPPEWPSEPSDVEFPSLFIDPVDDPLTIVEDEEPAEDLAPPAMDLSKLIQEVIDAIRAGNSVLVAKAGAGLNLEIEWQLGGAKVAVLSGHDGQRYVLVSLSAEASEDLRAAQRAHDERILHWIESLNEPVFDYDAAEEEDADYGDEPANEAIP